MANSLDLSLLPINYFYLDKTKSSEYLNPEVKNPGNKLLWFWNIKDSLERCRQLSPKCERYHRMKNPISSINRGLISLSISFWVSFGGLYLLRYKRERGSREWDGRIASLIYWTWIWANSRREWRTEEPGRLESMGSQRVGHDLTTGQQQQSLKKYNLFT